MKSKIHDFTLIAGVFITALLAGYFLYSADDFREIRDLKSISSSSPNAPIELKKGRFEYFFNLLRDPATNSIPPGIRQKELEFAKELQKNSKLEKGINGVNSLDWKEAGPIDVGGRTRALGIDVANPNIIIAGGTSGGIWKSTDKGSTWKMKSTLNQILSVTSLAQDTRTGFTNNWYYATGEFLGSANDMGFTHRFTGDGIYKSTDNGESWNILPSTVSPNPTGWDSDYDFVSKITVNPINGDIFIAVQASGIFRSTDGGNTFTNVLGGLNQHIFSDVVINSVGTVIAALSSPFSGNTPVNPPGLYKSTNSGNNWTNISPTSLPADISRSVIAYAQSNNNIAYMMTFTGVVTDEREDVRFYKINISTGASEDRSANLPDFEQNFEDYIKTQNSYNMVIAVKPDDENFVIIGGTSLFRSTNGFSSKPISATYDWIGGYHPQAFFYPNFHPDVHSFAFEPGNPNAMWWGNDGGLSYTSDIRTSSYTTYFPWENKNNGYNVTQFYTVAIHSTAGDNRIMGGTQDNGTPYFTYNGTTTSPRVDVSSGDGAYCYFGNDFAYTSAQNGRVLRLRYDGSKNPLAPFGNDPYKDISPSDATNQLFINPFAIDPNNEEIMYYLGGNVIWRNNQLSSVPDDFNRGTNIGWTSLTGLTIPAGYSLSTLAISKNNPNHRLYFAASNSSAVPKVYRLDNSNTAVSGAQDISVPGSPQGAYVHHIAVNPNNADEILVVYSNYNIPGLYFSQNGGGSYTSVEGNLEGTPQLPGPSIRAAEILPTAQGTMYLLATSTGVYSTTQLNGTSTNWSLEGPNVIGNVVVNYIASRTTDGKIVAGTHGRGAFTAEAGSASGTPVAEVNSTRLVLQSRPGESGSTNFVLSNTGEGTLLYNITASGQFVSALPKISSGKIKLVGGENIKRKIPPFKGVSVNGTELVKPGNVVSGLNKLDKSPSVITGSDNLILDDGDETADNFLGWGNGNDLAWINQFNLTDKGFNLDAITFLYEN